MSRKKISRDFTVDSSHYRSRIACIDHKHNLFITEREQWYERPRVVVDAFASSWLWGFADNTKGWLSIRSGEKIITPQGLVSVFVPPFQLVEWHVGVGLHKLTFLSSAASLPLRSPRAVTMFSWDGSVPTSLQEVNAALSSRHEEGLALEEGLRPSAVTLRAKHFIDQNFSEPIKISEVARVVGGSREGLARAFRRAYGISLVSYRNKLRVFEACQLMDLGHDVTTAAFQVGFSDMAQFIHHFKQNLGTTPIQYNPTKMSRRQSRGQPSVQVALLQR